MTDSQNHRKVAVRRDLWRTFKTTPLPKQVHLEQGFEYLQRRRLHSLPGHPVSVLCHPQNKQVLPSV